MRCIQACIWAAQLRRARLCPGCGQSGGGDADLPASGLVEGSEGDVYVTSGDNGAGVWDVENVLDAEYDKVRHLAGICGCLRCWPTF